MDHVELTEARIEVGRVTSLVSSPVCGATSVFIGKGDHRCFQKFSTKQTQRQKKLYTL